MDNKGISRLIKLQLNYMPILHITSQNLVGHDLYTTDTYSFSGIRLYVMRSDEDSGNENSKAILDFIHNR